MAVDNSTILDNVWLHQTNDYQQRIPNSTQATIEQTMRKLFDPMNGRYLNAFIDSLVNRIGLTYIHQQTWDNPLAMFDKGSLPYGSTVQELAVKWIRAHHYEDDDESLLALHRPDAASWYHTLNRQDYYPISVVEDELQQAFVDDGGLNRFVSQILAAPRNSDAYDTYRATLQLIATYEQNFGFYKKQVAQIADKESGEDFLVTLREDAELLGFPSARYNSGLIDDIPVFAKKGELVILMTPRVKANIDVRNLAAAFNRSDAEIEQRIVIVDEFPVANCEAIITTEDFFQNYNKLYRTTSFYNPQTLGQTYYLHHWQILSVSPFVPAIMYTTAEATSTPTVTQTVTGLTLTATAETAKAGGSVPLTVTLDGSLAGTPAGTDTSKFAVAPDAATFEIVAELDGEPVKPYMTTYVDDGFVLHTSKRLAAGTVLTITATSTYTNPGGETTTYSDTATVTIE
jgi:hypothetical protein